MDLLQGYLRSQIIGLDHDQLVREESQAVNHIFAVEFDRE